MTKLIAVSRNFVNAPKSDRTKLEVAYVEKVFRYLHRPDWGKERRVFLMADGVPKWNATSRTVGSRNAWDNPLGVTTLSLWFTLKINVVMTVATDDSICGDTMLGRLSLATCCNEILNTATPYILPVFLRPAFLIRFEISYMFEAMCVKMLAVWPYRWDGLVRPQFDLVLPTPATITKYWNINFRFSSIKQSDTRLYLRRSPANR